MGHSIAGTFGGLFGVALAAAPVILAAVFTRHDPAAVRMPLIVLAGAGYGLALAWAGVWGAARLAAGKLPELYQLAARSKL